MRKNRLFLAFFLAALLLALACTREDPDPRPLKVLSVTLNGANLVDGAANIPVKASVVMVFSAALDPSGFESAFSLRTASGTAGASFTYSNQSSKVTIDLDLDYRTTYTLVVGRGPVGQNGERLDEPVSLAFTTADDGVITALPPCTTGNDGCLQTASFSGDGTANFQFYSSFPIYEEKAEWQDISAAVVVVHGVNRNANDYFNYLMATLRAEKLEDQVVLIAPFFKNAGEAGEGDYYWAGSAWREGRNAASAARISSFEIVDRLIDQLANREHFPVLEKIILTGQSSGALFTHLYAGANRVEEKYADISFEYLVSESQYFYYPDGRRINESSDELYLPTGCTGYDIWPVGFNVIPPYLESVDQSGFNDRFLNRSVTYLLGNGTGTDSSLNTSDCYATLLGSSRYQRGENMFRYLELGYSGVHHHSKIIVEGVLHDGSAIFQSSEFRSLLRDLLE